MTRNIKELKKVIFVGLILMLFGGVILFFIEYTSTQDEVLFSKKGITNAIQKEQNRYYFTFVDDSITEYYTTDLYVSLLNVNGIHKVDLTQVHTCEILYEPITEDLASIQALTIDGKVFFSHQDTFEKRASNTLIGKILGAIFFLLGCIFIISYLIWGNKKKPDLPLDNKRM